MGLHRRVSQMIFGAIGMALLLGAGPAAAMSVAEFLQKADALKAKGMMAMFAKSEIKLLMDEAKGAAEAYRQDVSKAQARRDPSYGCPPAKGKARLTSDDLLKGFRALPAERQATTSVKAGFYDLMKSRYPCP
ncbi:MAG: hypothetical protein J0I80_04605 [Sphingomonas sp.]|nr:hypothetical protein [Sphingomonas sp.]